MNNTILFIGYSLNDSTFNSIFRLIQKGFDGNARNAYFFTANEPNKAAVEYYKNKGIRVIFHGELVDEKHIGECTADFLQLLESDSKSEPETAEQLWDTISFFNQLSFVSTQDVVNYSNLISKVLLHPKDTLIWQQLDKGKFEVSENEDIKKFIDGKTWFEEFLGYKSDVENNYNQNSVLGEGYKLYENDKYKEARQKFREIANEAFIRKDYWNYLVAEFNVDHINGAFGEELPVDLPISGNNDMEKMIESLMSNGDEGTKKICTYFRDEIRSFRFIYKVIFRMTELRDKLRNERNSYKRGGFSHNSNLWEAGFEFKSLLTFIQANCITVFQYREFLSVVNLYLECLLIAHDNSNYKVDENDLFGWKTSSIIEEISLGDVKSILPYFDRKNLASLMENYQLSKIYVSQESVEFLTNLIIELSKELQSEFKNENFSDLTKCVDFLSVIHLKDSNSLVTVLGQFPIFGRNSSNLKTVLRCLVNAIDSISSLNYKEIIRIINLQIGEIVNGNLEDYSDCWRLYALIIKKINVTSEQSGLIENEFLLEKLLLINIQDDKIKEIIKYQYLLINLYKYFSSGLKTVTDSILSKYEKLTDSDINLYFIEQMALHNVNEFRTKKDSIIQMEVATISETEGQIKYSPDPRKRAISNLFTFIQNDYFTLDEVKKYLDIEKMKGVFPEVDWVLFQDYSDEMIARLVENRTFKNTREFFGKSEKEKLLIDEWLIRQVTDGKVKISDNK